MSFILISGSWRERKQHIGIKITWLSANSLFQIYGVGSYAYHLPQEGVEDHWRNMDIVSFGGHADILRLFLPPRADDVKDVVNTTAVTPYMLCKPKYDVFDKVNGFFILSASYMIPQALIFNRYYRLTSIVRQGHQTTVIRIAQPN